MLSLSACFGATKTGQRCRGWRGESPPSSSPGIGRMWRRILKSFARGISLKTQSRLLRMPDDSNLRLWLAVWIGAVAFILFSRWRERGVGVGLVLAYFLSLWVIH